MPDAFGERSVLELVTQLSSKLWASWVHFAKILRFLLIKIYRPVILLCVVILVLLIASWLDSRLIDGAIYRGLFDPPKRHPGDSGPEWKDLFQALLVILGLPVALILWHWRDRNVHHQIQNQRKDTNLREFQEIQRVAVGAMDKDCPADASETLQIAALHQMRGYLRGEYGESFRRPAFELYCAMLARPLSGRSTKNAKSRSTAGGSVVQGIPPIVYTCLRDVVFEEWRAFFRSGFPLASRTLREIRLPEQADLSYLDLSNTNFENAVLRGVLLRNTVLNGAILDGIDAGGAICLNLRGKGISCDRAEFSGAVFCYAEVQFRGAKVSFRRANLREAVLTGSDSQVDVSGADLRKATFHGMWSKSSDVAEAIFDQTTRLFPLGTGKRGEASANTNLEILPDAWRAAGAKFIPNPREVLLRELSSERSELTLQDIAHIFRELSFERSQLTLEDIAPGLARREAAAKRDGHLSN